MTDGPTRREIKQAIEDLADETLDRSKATITVSSSLHDDLRKEAGLEPSHPGYKWDDTRSTEFWDRRLA